MANRYLYESQFAYEKGIVFITGRIEIGAVGAPTLDVTRSRGIASVVRDAAGTYTITLQDKFNALRFAGYELVGATARDITFQTKAQDVDGTKTIEIYTNTAGTPTDPGDGDAIKVFFVLKNSGV